MADLVKDWSHVVVWSGVGICGIENLKMHGALEIHRPHAKWRCCAPDKRNFIRCQMKDLLGLKHSIIRRH
jgi:hypothetical protein